MNVPPTISRVLMRDKGLLALLTTTLGLEDLHDILEVIRVEDHNRALIEQALAEEGNR